MNNRTISQSQAPATSIPGMRRPSHPGETVLFYMMVRACANALADRVLESLAEYTLSSIRTIVRLPRLSFNAPSPRDTPLRNPQWRPLSLPYLTRTASWE